MPLSLVSIISEQTIPNFLILKEYAGRVDEFIFLTTQTMETNNLKTSRSAWLANALGLDLSKIKRVVLKEDDYFYNLEQLSKDVAEHKEYILNITGGTKIMVLSAYDFFKSSRKTSKIIYLPINQNVIKTIYPDNSEENITFKVSVEEYLKTYGLNFVYQNPLKDEESLKIIYKQYKQNGFNVNKQNTDYEEQWRNYFTGIWFEEWIYYKIKRDLNLDDNAILYNVKVAYQTDFKEHTSDNELDVVFIKNNKLNIVECKVSLGKNENKLDEACYKLGSIQKNFGINCNSYVCTLSVVENLENKRRKAKLSGVTNIFDRTFFNPMKSFNEVFR
jgi:hypothetical protein